MNVNSIKQKDISKNIESMEKDLADLKARQQDLEDNPMKALAEFLHEELCSRHHSGDGCAWAHGSWEEPLRHSRKKYLEMARKLVVLLSDDMDKVRKVVLMVKKG